MPDVFISYSRRDNQPPPPSPDGFVTRLATALEDQEFDVWMDKDDIRPAHDFQKDIDEGIITSNAFLLVISPDSLKSPYCRKEIDLAISNHKRLVPVMRCQHDPETGGDIEVPPEFGPLNWIFARETDDFETAVRRITLVLRSGDQRYIHTHTRLVGRALQWEEQGRTNGYLLRRADLTEAEAWQAQSMSGVEPQPTPLLLEYIAASRRAATGFQRFVTAVSLVGLAIMSVLAVVAVLNAGRADQNAQIADANAATAERRADEAHSLALAAYAQNAAQTDKILALALSVEANSIVNPPALAQTVLSRYAYEGGQILGLLPGTLPQNDRDSVYTTAFSRDGKLLATGTLQGTLNIWDAETLELKQGPLQHQYWITALSFSPDGRYLLAGGGDFLDAGELRLWDVEAGTSVQLKGQSHTITAAGFTQDSRTAISLSTSGLLIFWDVAEAAEINRFEVQGGFGFSVNGALNADGSRLWILPSLLPRVTVLDTATLQQISQVVLDVTDVCSRFALHPDESKLLCATGIGSPPALILMDALSGEVIRTYQGFEQTLNSIVFSPDGTRVLAGGDDGMILWDINVSVPLHNFTTNTMVTSVNFSPDGTRILANLGSEGTAVIWDATLRNGAALGEPLLIDTTANTNPLSAFSFTRDADALYVASNSILLLNAADGNKISEFSLSGPGFSSVQALDNGVLAGQFDGTISRWTSESSQPLWQLREHADSINDITVTADGRLGLSGSRDGYAFLWDTDTGQVLHRWDGLPYGVQRVALTPSGDFAAAVGCTQISSTNACVDSALLVWDTRTGTQRYMMPTPGGNQALAGSPDGKYWLTNGLDDQLYLVSVTDGAVVKQFSGHNGAILSAAFNQDGSRAITGGGTRDGSIILWDVELGAPLRQISIGRGIQQIAFSPEGHRAASIGYRLFEGPALSDLTLWRLDAKLDDLLGWTHSNRFLRELTCSERRNYNLSVLCDENGEAPTRTPYPSSTPTPTLDPTQVTQTPTHTPTPLPSPTATFTPTAPPTPVMVAQVPTPDMQLGVIYGVQWSPDGERFLTGHEDGTVRVWDSILGVELYRLEGHNSAVMRGSRGQWSPDGDRILTWSSNYSALIWDAGTGQLLFTLSGHLDDIRYASWSSDGLKVVTAAMDNTARIWDATTGASLAELRGHSAPLEHVQWSPDNTRIATASDDETARIWDAATGEQQFVFANRQPTEGMIIGDIPAEVWGVFWSPDGSKVIAVGIDGLGIVWDTSTGEQTMILRVPSLNPALGPYVINAFWTDDGSRILLHAPDTMPTVWNAHTGELQLVLAGHLDYVTRALWSPDESQILTTGTDGLGFIWDAQTGEITRTFDHRATIQSAAWSPDGTLILTTAVDGTIRLWDARSGREQAFLYPPASQIMTPQVTLVNNILATQFSTLIPQLETLVADLSGGDTISPAEIGVNDGTLLQDETERWRYSGVEGEVITIRFEASYTVMLRILAPDGTTVVEAETALLENVRLPVNGQYSIEIARTVNSETPSPSNSLESIMQADYVLTIESSRVGTPSPG